MLTANCCYVCRVLVSSPYTSPTVVSPEIFRWNFTLCRGPDHSLNSSGEIGIHYGVNRKFHKTRRYPLWINDGGSQLPREKIPYLEA